MRTVMMVALVGCFALAGWCQGPAPGAPPAAPGPGGQPGMPGGMPPGGMGGPGMMGPGMGMPQGAMPMAGPAPVAPVMMIVDGVVYIAFEGKVTAFEAKTLKKLGEAVYAAPQKPKQRGQGQGQGQGQRKLPKAGGPLPPAPAATPKP